MFNSNPSPDELAEWYTAAIKRKAILPSHFQIQGRYITISCSIDTCMETFTRRLLPGRNDPVYACPKCHSRIYVPVEW